MVQIMTIHFVEERNKKKSPNREQNHFSTSSALAPARYRQINGRNLFGRLRSLRRRSGGMKRANDRAREAALPSRR